MAEAKKSKETTTENGFPTNEQLKAWEDKHGELSQLDIDEDNEICAIVRMPILRDLKHASSVSAKKTAVDGAEAIFNNCVLWCHPAVRTNDKYLASAIAGMGELSEIKEAKIKKISSGLK